ncbi:hypothetical protein ACILPE_06685 [Capnocytophaga canimorsus]|uniref:hypothetical protein n=1 Tax=Capnocytophaga canimorsus TaxID=28188 RepID=UPI0037D4E869
MKKYIFLILCILPSYILAQKQVFPKEKFDAKDAENKLAYGNSTIKGVAVTREYAHTRGIKEFTGEKHLAPKGTVVMLFPVTDYFKAYYKLRNKYKESIKYVAAISAEAFSYRIETQVGDNGEFVFEKMKPGKYYIETTSFQYSGTAVGHREIGRTHYWNGLGHYKGYDPIYEKYNYNYTGVAVESAFVEIKKDGEIKKIKL